MNTLAASSFSMITNLESRYVYGNRRSGGVKISHWNKGPGHLQNKMADICSIVQDFWSKILGISESCFLKSHDTTDVSIEDYSVTFSKTLENHNIGASRITVYIHKDISASIRYDLMTDSFNSIWLEIGNPRQKKILICMIYREWQLWNQTSDNSSQIESQFARWISFLEKWEVA